ncbi:MAG: hypothetical protein FIA82_10085 [Melioribacter sp.]|nr:hypothetical protein [Melioribacter sp.]
MFPIANIKFYLNRIIQEDNLDFYNSIKSSLSSSIENDFSKTTVYEGIRLTYYCPSKDEIGIIIFLKFVGIYQTEINYRFIYEIISKIIDSYKNKSIQDIGEKYSSIVAVNYYELIQIKEIILHLEKYYSKILENTKDKHYDIDINIEQIINSTVNYIKQNEYFLKCHRTTKFHDIDIKIWETRQALACGLTLTAIVMLGVTLEECLKTVLKNDYEQQIRKTQTGASIQLLSDASLQAEEEFGDLQLYKLIVALYEAKYIDDAEREHLLHIKDYIRNAFIHSDKSKIFDKNRKGRVDVFRLVDHQIKHVETQQLSMLEMSFAQGFMQKRLADDNAKIIFYEIEEYIFTISNRFWKKWE